MKKETPKNGTHKRYCAHNRESDTPFYRSTEVEENYKNGVLHGKVTKTINLRPMGRYTNSGRMQYGAGDVAYECHYKNGVYAYMWLHISDPNEEGNGSEARDKLAQEMTAAEIATAQKLARECVAKNYKGC